MNEDTDIESLLDAMTEETLADIATTSGDEVGITPPKRGRGRPKELPDDPLERKMFQIRKKLAPDIIEELEQLSVVDLHGRLAQCEKNIYESEKAREADEGLATLKEEFKEASAPYNEVKKHQGLIATYAACLLDKEGEI